MLPRNSPWIHPSGATLVRTLVILFMIPVPKDGGPVLEGTYGSPSVPYPTGLTYPPYDRFTLISEGPDTKIRPKTPRRTAQDGVANMGFLSC